MRVLLAIDESHFSQEAVRAVLAQVRKRGTKVQVLTVLEPISAYMSADLFPHLVSHVAAIEEDRRKQADELVQRAARKLRQAGFKATEVVEAGDPKAKIIEQAAGWRADLIVLGSYGLKGLDRFLMGSVSEAVSRHAACSVQIVRPREPQARANAKKRSRRPSR